jgi:hypothetical protein
MLKTINNNRLLLSFGIIKLIGTVGLSLFAYLAQAKSTDVREVEDFTEIEASNAINIVLQKCSKKEKLEARIEVDGMETKDVVIKSKGDGLLSISIKAKLEPFDAAVKAKKQKATVYLKFNTIERIKLKTASQVSIDEGQELSAKNLEIIADSGSKADLMIAVSGELKITAKSAAKLKLTGKVANANLDVSSAALVDMSEIELNDVEIMASSASTVKVCAKKSLKASVSSLAKLIYSGEPTKIEIEKGSMGTVKLGEVAST